MPLNVVFVVPTISGGGAERVASIWINEISSKKIQSYIIALYPVDNEYNVRNDVNKIYIYKDYMSYKKTHVLKKIIDIRKTVKTIIKEKTIVVPFVSYIGILCHISTCFVDVIFIETIRNNPWITPNNKFIRLLRDLSINKSDGWIFQNEEQLEYFKKRNIKDCSLIIDNPISDNLFYVEHNYKSNIHTLVSVGRIHEQKNQLFQIEAINILVKKYPNIQLYIYGQGNNSYSIMLENKIKEYNLNENVFLCGNKKNIELEITKYDIYIMTSKYEGMPNALMEAMAIGLPCVSSNCKTGPKNLINHEYNGFLYSNYDICEFVKYIDLLICNPWIAKEIGNNARLSLKDRKNSNNIDKLISYFEEI